MGAKPNNSATEKKLSDDQDRAIQALIAGKTVSQAAAAAKVHRTTVHRWQHEVAFVTALGDARLEAWQANRDRLSALADVALDTLEEFINSENDALKYRAAALILRLSSDLPQPAEGFIVAAARALENIDRDDR